MGIDEFRASCLHWRYHDVPLEQVQKGGCVTLAGLTDKTNRKIMNLKNLSESGF